VPTSATTAARMRTRHGARFRRSARFTPGRAGRRRSAYTAPGRRP
jgi:hypothetical protein